MKSSTTKINTARQRTRHSMNFTTSRRSSALTLLLLACIGVSSKLQAVSPPPDGAILGAILPKGNPRFLASLPALTTRPLASRRSLGIPQASQTRRLVRAHCLATRPDKATQPLDQRLSAIILLAPPTWPSVLVHLLSRQTASAIRPSVITRSEPTLPASKTRPLATKRLLSAMALTIRRSAILRLAAILPETSTRPLVKRRCSAIRPVALTSPSAEKRVTVSSQPITLSVSAQTFLERT